MPISQGDLTHSATIIQRSSNASRDAYGNLSHTETSAEAPCFYDVPKRKVEFSFESKTYVAEAVLFLLPSQAVKVGDKVQNVKDASGQIVDANLYRVMRVDPFMDGQSLHHKEVYLVTNF